jgi:PPOX class probable F420-dependent enzyme
MMLVETRREDTERPQVETRAEADVPAIDGRFLSITSYRGDGSGVATPVWFVREGGRLLVMTAADSGKVKRIRRDPSVRIAACTARGRPKMEPVRAHAEILPLGETDRVMRLIARRYRVDLVFVRPIRAIQALFRPERRHEETVILAITPSPAHGRGGE